MKNNLLYKLLPLGIFIASAVAYPVQAQDCDKNYFRKEIFWAKIGIQDKEIRLEKYQKRKDYNPESIYAKYLRMILEENQKELGELLKKERECFAE